MAQWASLFASFDVAGKENDLERKECIFSVPLLLCLSLPLFLLKIDFGFFVSTFVPACGCARVLTAKIKSERLCMYKSHFFLLLIHLLPVNPQDRQRVTGFEILTESHKRPREREARKGPKVKDEAVCNSISGKSRMHQLQDTKRKRKRRVRMQLA